MRKHTVCERLDKGSSKSEIACEYNIDTLTISDIYKSLPSLKLIKSSFVNDSILRSERLWNKLQMTI